jgi:chemotaxis response regulator CheB
MLRQIVRRIAEDAPELDVVAELPDASLDSPEVLRAEPDVVITGADRMSEDAVTNLLRRRHPMRILGISADARQVTLHELRPQRVPLGELAPATLIAAIRGGQQCES